MAKKKQSERIEFETYKEVGAWQVKTLQFDRPSCFNNVVSIRKYRVTIELVDEPVEVLQERLQTLWETMQYNMHHYPMTAAANELGYKLQGSMGAKREES